jgi:predicted negative regulator of RcsB-dependent stress response
VDRHTRKDLKTDKFALEVRHGVEYVSDHRKQAMRVGGVALGVLIVILGVYFYRQYQHGVRQEALHHALLIQNAAIGPQQNEFTPAFPTQPERQKAAVKAFSDLAAKYPGTEEGVIAQYYLATNAADSGKIPEAQKRFESVVEDGSANIASLAKLALAQIYASEGRLADGEKLLRGLMDNPTVLVSKEQATFALAHLLENTRPEEARKLLEPFRSSQRTALSRAAISALSNAPAR